MSGLSLFATAEAPLSASRAAHASADAPYAVATAWSHNGSRLLVASSDNRLLLFTPSLVHTETVPARLSRSGPSPRVCSLAFSPTNDGVVAVGYADGLVDVYDVSRVPSDPKRIVSRHQPPSALQDARGQADGRVLLLDWRAGHDVVCVLSDGRVLSASPERKTTSLLFVCPAGTHATAVASASGQSLSSSESGSRGGVAFVFSLSDGTLFHYRPPTEAAPSDDVSSNGRAPRLSSPAMCMFPSEDASLVCVCPAPAAETPSLSGWGSMSSSSSSSDPPLGVCYQGGTVTVLDAKGNALATLSPPQSEEDRKLWDPWVTATMVARPGGAGYLVCVRRSGKTDTLAVRGTETVLVVGKTIPAFGHWLPADDSSPLGFSRGTVFSWVPSSTSLLAACPARGLTFLTVGRAGGPLRGSVGRSASGTWVQGLDGEVSLFLREQAVSLRFSDASVGTPFVVDPTYVVAPVSGPAVSFVAVVCASTRKRSLLPCPPATRLDFSISFPAQGLCAVHCAGELRLFDLSTSGDGAEVPALFSVPAVTASASVTSFTPKGLVFQHSPTVMAVTGPIGSHNVPFTLLPPLPRALAWAAPSPTTSATVASLDEAGSLFLLTPGRESVLLRHGCSSALWLPTPGDVLVARTGKGGWVWYAPILAPSAALPLPGSDDVVGITVGADGTPAVVARLSTMGGPPTTTEEPFPRELLLFAGAASTAATAVAAAAAASSIAEATLTSTAATNAVSAAATALAKATAPAGVAPLWRCLAAATLAPFAGLSRISPESAPSTAAIACAAVEAAAAAGALGVAARCFSAAGDATTASLLLSPPVAVPPLDPTATETLAVSSSAAAAAIAASSVLGGALLGPVCSLSKRSLGPTPSSGWLTSNHPAAAARAKAVAQWLVRTHSWETCAGLPLPDQARAALLRAWARSPAADPTALASAAKEGEAESVVQALLACKTSLSSAAAAGIAGSASTTSAAAAAAAAADAGAGDAAATLYLSLSEPALAVAALFNTRGNANTRARAYARAHSISASTSAASGGGTAAAAAAAAVAAAVAEGEWQVAASARTSPGAYSSAASAAAALAASAFPPSAGAGAAAAAADAAAAAGEWEKVLTHAAAVVTCVRGVEISDKTTTAGAAAAAVTAAARALAVEGRIAEAETGFATAAAATSVSGAGPGASVGVLLDGAELLAAESQWSAAARLWTLAASTAASTGNGGWDGEASRRLIRTGLALEHALIPALTSLSTRCLASTSHPPAPHPAPTLAPLARAADAAYLLSGDVDRAIALAQRLWEVRRMLALVKRHRPELRARAVEAVAKRLGAERREGEAEALLLSPPSSAPMPAPSPAHVRKEGNGLWRTILADMRGGGRWGDCLRLAQAHGNEEAALKVAYAWVTSEIPTNDDDDDEEEGDDCGVSTPALSYLNANSLGPSVVFLALERGELTPALLLARVLAPALLPQVNKARAAAAAAAAPAGNEGDAAARRAERLYLLAGDLASAARVWSDREQWAEAERVAALAAGPRLSSRKDATLNADTGDNGALLRSVLTSHASACAASGLLRDAEALFLRARAPALAVEAYERAQQWGDAARVAEGMGDVARARRLGERAREQAVSDAQGDTAGWSGAEVLAKAKRADAAASSGGKKLSEPAVSAAVTLYLSLSPRLHIASSTPPGLPPNDVAAALERASHMATASLPRARAHTVARTAAEKLSRMPPEAEAAGGQTWAGRACAVLAEAGLLGEGLELVLSKQREGTARQGEAEMLARKLGGADGIALLKRLKAATETATAAATVASLSTAAAVSQAQAHAQAQAPPRVSGEAEKFLAFLGPAAMTAASAGDWERVRAIAASLDASAVASTSNEGRKQPRKGDHLRAYAAAHVSALLNQSATASAAAVAFSCGLPPATAPTAVAAAAAALVNGFSPSSSSTTSLVWELALQTLRLPSGTPPQNPLPPLPSYPPQPTTAAAAAKSVLTRVLALVAKTRVAPATTGGVTASEAAEEATATVTAASAGGVAWPVPSLPSRDGVNAMVTAAAAGQGLRALLGGAAGVCGVGVLTRVRGALHLMHAHARLQRHAHASEGAATVGRVAAAALSLLRCCDIAPADALYYAAGDACKRAAASTKTVGTTDVQESAVVAGKWEAIPSAVWLRAAQLLWGRFSELHKVIADPTSGNLSEDGFADAPDIPSLSQTPLPPTAAISETAAAEVSEWVVEALAGDGFSGTHNDGYPRASYASPQLPQGPCPVCGTVGYAFSLRCSTPTKGCGTVHVPCCVTGAPLSDPSDAAECSHGCGAKANRADWAAWVRAERSCPWCGKAEDPDALSHL